MMPGKITNLNRARKARVRSEQKARAEANAVKHGRSKAQKTLEVAREAKARKLLDQHQLDDDAPE